MAATRKFYNWTAQPFEIPAQVREHFAKIQTELAAYEAQWNKEFDGIKKAAPALAQAFEDQMSGKLPHGIEEKLPSFDPAKPVATRQASGTVINYFADNIPAFVGGSADLAPSNKTAFANRKDKMLHFGIREHGMPLSRDGFPVFDFILAGIGGDGHTASLFPDGPELFAADRPVTESVAPEGYAVRRRITLTLPVLRAARRLLFTVSGLAKINMLDSNPGPVLSALVPDRQNGNTDIFESPEEPK